MFEIKMKYFYTHLRTELSRPANYKKTCSYIVGSFTNQNKPF